MMRLRTKRDRLVLETLEHRLNLSGGVSGGGPPPIGGPPTSFPTVPGVVGHVEFPPAIMGSPALPPIQNAPGLPGNVQFPTNVDLSAAQNLTYALAGEFATGHAADAAFAGLSSDVVHGNHEKFSFDMHDGADFMRVTEMIKTDAKTGQVDAIRLNVVEEEGTTLLAYRLVETPNRAQFGFVEVNPTAVDVILASANDSNPNDPDQSLFEVTIGPGGVDVYHSHS
ncbi:MAG TPA: hypothetical protein VNH11_00655 [Pirellulales bacterium]|nr:hypothetical protein [Pirellulales bacterium]